MSQPPIVKSIRSLKSLVDHDLAKKDELPLLEKVIDQFSLAITPDMYQIIDGLNPDDPIAQQFVPRVEELNISPDEIEDPIGDTVFSVVRGIIHRYPDRCLFTPVHICPVYCRFCFRREKVGSNKGILTEEELNLAYEYIDSHPGIWEVILTGGDPLILKPKIINDIIKRLNAIPHVEVIRIHTRVPVVDPQRIDKNMLSVLTQRRPIYIILHANHPNEFTPGAIRACADLVDAGIPMLSQSVLLKGINDHIDVLSQLMRTFIKNRIKPYYLHQGDLAKGTEHFRTSIAEGQQLMRELRGTFSGLCQPTYILDIPGGHGKSPIGPNYLKENIVESQKKNSYIIEDYRGDTHDYSQYPSKKS